MAKRLALCGVFCFAAANRPVVLVPGLTGSGLEVKQHAAAMPHWYCKKDTHDKWMKAWVDPAPWTNPPLSFFFGGGSYGGRTDWGTNSRNTFEVRILVYLVMTGFLEHADVGLKHVRFT